jgi:HlyD family secretion protein
MKVKIVLLLPLLATLLAACGQNPTSQPIPSTPTSSVSPIVSASGKVLPARWANLSLQSGGQIVEMKVQAGDSVKAGEVLMQLDQTDAQLAVAQAEATLAGAQAQLAQLKAGARPEQIAVADQAVKSADATVWAASAQLAQLQVGAKEADIAAAESAVAAAYTDQKVAQDFYDKIHKVGGTPEEQARARLNAANQAYAAAQARLDQLQAGPTKNELDAARANVAAAQAQRGTAQAQLDLLKAGATTEEIAVAEAGVKQAQVGLDTAKDHLAKLQLTAPFDGAVGSVFVQQGELITPGQPAVAVGDLTTLRVETTDLSEIDVARVKEGQTVKVTFDALPGLTLDGKVSRIAPMSTPGQSGVNYLVIVDLDRLDPALRWGMTAFVDIQVGQ